MIDKAIARAIANIAILLEFSDSSIVDADAALHAMEQLASDLQSLGEGERKDLIQQLLNVAKEYSGEQAEFVLALPEALNIDD